MPSDRRRIEANSRAYWGLRGPPLEKANQPLRSGRRNLRGYAVTLQPLFSRSLPSSSQALPVPPFPTWESSLCMRIAPTF